MINLLIQIKFRKGYYFFTCFKEFLEKNPVVRQIPAVRYMKSVLFRIMHTAFILIIFFLQHNTIETIETILFTNYQTIFIGHSPAN